jgi:hypothetical protein
MTEICLSFLQRKPNRNTEINEKYFNGAVTVKKVVVACYLSRWGFVLTKPRKMY